MRSSALCSHASAAGTSGLTAASRRTSQARSADQARNAKLEIGYILAPAKQGRGLMTEALEALLAYCFEELAVHRVEALIHPDNAASIRLLENTGFVREGYAREYLCIAGSWQDHLLFAILRGDRAAPPT